MSVSGTSRSLWSAARQYVIPAEHGGWFLWIGPFILGALAAGRLSTDLLWLLCLLLAAYLSRQPLLLIVKSLSGRRARAAIVPALKALALVGLLLLALLGVLLVRGYWYLLGLAIPAVPVLALQMWLVSRRKERQIGIELMGAGVLSLAATASYWVCLGRCDVAGWWLWALSWLYNASAIVYVYLRLQQRRWTAVSDWGARSRAGQRTVLYAGTNLTLVVLLAVAGLVPVMTPLAFALALAHFLYGVAVPCVRARPARVGIEQSMATLAFFVLLALVYR